MDQPTKEKLLAQWLEGKLSEEELLQSVTKDELDEYKAIINTVDNWEPEGSDSIENKAQEILSSPKEAKVVSINRRAWITGIAASLALVAVLTIFLIPDSKQTYYAYDEVKEITLPDNSTKVILSPGSSISYEDFDVENRQVQIEGRVYFDVTEKGSFRVSYNEGNIDVLGTQFEVVDLDGVFEATCFEGLVQIEYRGKRAKAGVKDRVAYLRGGLVKSQVNSSKPGWTDQETEVFENANLEKVIKVMESRYEVAINTEKIELDRRFTGSIPTDNLDQACKKVFSTLGIQYKIEGKQVLLSE